MKRLLLLGLFASTIYGAQTVSTPTTYLSTATITINSGSAFSTQSGVTVQFGGNRLLGVDTPIDPTDGVNKAYVDALVVAGTPSPTPTATPTATPVVFPHAVTLVCDGSGSVVSTGTKNPVKIPYGGTLVGWLLIGSPSGSVTVDVFRAANGAGLPVTSIIGGSGTKPALSSAVENSSTSFTSWTSTALTAKDNLAISLSGVTSLTYMELTLYFQ